MKKIIGALLVGAMIGGVAFAEASIGLNARVYTDAFTYAGVSEADKKADDNDRGKDDNGTVTWFKDTKHADDVTLSAATEGAGAKIVLTVTGPVVGSTAGKIEVGAYQLWLNKGNFRLDAGAFDTRAINLASYDGNWGSNYCGFKKAGLWDAAGFDGSYVRVKTNGYGLDATNISVRKDKKGGNIMMATYNFADLGLTVRGGVFLNGVATTYRANGTVDKLGSYTTTENGGAAPFVPFGVQGVYKVGKAATVAATVKMVDAVNPAAAPDYSEWTFNVSGLITAIDKTKIMVGYTLDAAFLGTGPDGEKEFTHTDGKKYKWSDSNEFVHGIDVRVENTSVKNLGVYLNAAFQIMPATQFKTDTTTEWGKLTQAQKNGYDNEDAYKDSVGLNGKMALWTTFGANYKLNDTVAVVFQGKYTCEDFAATRTNKDAKVMNDAAAKMALNLRPGVDITFAKGCIFSAGVDVGLKNFSKSVVAGKEYDALTTTVSVPMMMRVKL